MEIRVVEEKGRAQIEVTILSGPDDPRVSGIVRQLQMVDGKMTGYVPGTINRRVVLLADVAWIQTDGSVTLIHLVNGGDSWKVLVSFDRARGRAQRHGVCAHFSTGTGQLGSGYRYQTRRFRPHVAVAWRETPCCFKKVRCGNQTTYRNCVRASGFSRASLPVPSAKHHSNHTLTAVLSQRREHHGTQRITKLARN